MFGCPPNRGNFNAVGGTKHARGSLAIPTKRVRRGAHGVVPSQRPKALARAVKKGNLIFQAVGRKGKLALMYVLRPFAQIKKDVPFYEDFAASMQREIMKRFPDAIAKAMATRR
jgi:hypothetical protein